MWTKAQTCPSSILEGFSTLTFCIKVVEKYEVCGEDGGLSPLFLPSYFVGEPSPLEDLEPSPCSCELLSS